MRLSAQIPEAPCLGHGLSVLSQDLLSGEKPENGDLGETAEEKLFFARLFKPKSGSFRMHVPGP